MPYQENDIIKVLAYIDEASARLGTTNAPASFNAQETQGFLFGRDLISGALLVRDVDRPEVFVLAETERAARDLLTSLPRENDLLLHIPQDWVLRRARVLFDLQPVEEGMYAAKRRTPGLPNGVSEFYAKVDSQKHPVVDRARVLQTERGRDEIHMYAAHGPLLLARAIAAKAPFAYVLYTPKFGPDPEAELLLGKLRELRVPHYLITDGLMRKCVDTAYVPTVLSVLKEQLISPDDLYLGPKALVLVCESVEEHGNLGMILRTADAVAADAVCICGEGCDPFAWKTITGSRGSIFRVPLVHEKDTAKLLTSLKQKGCLLVGTDLSGDRSHFGIDYTSSTAILVGNESSGLSPTALELCDYKVLIPMPGEPDSLNVGVSAGVMLYEALRQRIT